ncbi:hypothetical protein JTY60_01785 [symbiont of Argiope bruennichi]|uniref:hypothetical protein n=1 Tax=symbiont of Argiope bruennichi TaxID=2810479 RepID=UPI003DA52A16
MPSLFTVADDNLTIEQPSEEGQPVSFNFNATSVIGQFTVSGKANKGALNTEANFLGLFNKNNLKLNINGNYFVAINLDKK